MKKRKEFEHLYTTIIHRSRIKHGLSNNDYCIANAIYHLSHNPDSAYPGWYFGKVKTLGMMFGFSRATAYNCVQRLIKKGLVYKEPESGFLKTTKLWWDEFVNYQIRQSKN